MKPTLVDDNWVCALYVASRALEKRGYLNKTRFQKLVYFAQEVGGLPSNYRFAIDYYGPYERELAAHLSLSHVLGYTRVSVTNGKDHRIELLAPGSELLLQSQEQIASPREAIENVIGELANRPAAELGLLATVHFVSKRSAGQTREEIVNRVHGLKPERNSTEITEAYDELCKLGWLQ